MKIKTQGLIGPALDWSVAKAVGYDRIMVGSGGSTVWAVKYEGNQVISHHDDYSPSTDWEQCGPLISHYQVEFYHQGGYYTAIIDSDTQENCLECGCVIDGGINGTDHLLAACRAIVAANLGDTVDVPEELA